MKAPGALDKADAVTLREDDDVWAQAAGIFDDEEDDAPVLVDGTPAPTPRRKRNSLWDTVKSSIGLGEDDK